MAKRFTDSEKYKDPWFRRLRPPLKMLFQFMCDDCNHAGIWKENFDSFESYYKISLTHDDMKDFGERVSRIDEDTYLIKSFVKFQYGTLNPNNNAHLGVIKAMQYSGVDVSPYLAPSEPLGRVTGKGKGLGAGYGIGKGLGEGLPCKKTISVNEIPF